MNDSGQKYLRKVARDENGMSDIYAVTDAWGVTSAVGQAVKKLLMAGKRGHKDYWTDLQQAKDAIDRELIFRLAPVEKPVHVQTAHVADALRICPACLSRFPADMPCPVCAPRKSCACGNLHCAKCYPDVT